MDQNLGGRLLCLGIVAIQLGCVSGFRKGVTVNHELPADLPKEYKDKFEIREESGPYQVVSDGEQTQSKSKSNGKLPALAQVKGRKKRRHKSEKSAKAPSAEFVYRSRHGAKDSIWLGERLVFSIKYFGVSAGDFTLETLSYKMIANRRVYHIRGTAVSSPLFSIFYRLHDVVETFFDYEGSFSHRFHILLDESRQRRDALELYDSEKRQTYYWNRWHPKDSDFKETKEFGPIEPFSQDSLSALYYLRTLPLPTGAVVTFPVVSEGKTWEALCTVVRREPLDTPLGKVQTVVIKPEMKFNGVLKSMGDSFVWFTDDDRRIPVRLEAKVKVGTVSAELSQVELGTPTAPKPQPSPVVNFKKSLLLGGKIFITRK